MDFIFDFDGTIIDTKTCMESALKETFSFYNIKVTSDNIFSRLSMKPEDIFKIEIIRNFDDKMLSEFLDMYRKLFLKKRMKEAGLFGDVLSTLNYLRNKNSRLFLISNNSHAETMKKLKLLGIESYFVDVVGSDTLTSYKPHPLPVEHLVEMYDLRKKHLFMVGDAPNDIKMAHAAHIKSCAILTGVSSYEKFELENPSYIFERISSITKLA
ncbi:MAG: HAD family hydrolase [Erysipelothrix sp.]|nr:HAD family hydrolase [Erysipelothrix sp.]